MANLIKWAGKTVTLTVANKAANNTGIGYIKCAATNVDTNGYTYHCMVVNQINSEHITNSGPGVTSASTAVFTTSTFQNLPAYNSGIATFTPKFKVKWSNGGETHDIPASPNIELHYPATELKSNIVSGTYIYSDATKQYTVWAFNNRGATNDTHGEKNGAFAQNTARLTISSLDTYSGIPITKTITATSNTAFNLSFDNTSNISSCTRVELTSRSKAGDNASDNTNAAPTELSRTDSIYLMNATKQISLNKRTDDSIFYVVKGQNLPMEFDIIPANPGIAYSYAVTLTKTPSTVASHTLTAASAGKKGSIAIQGLAVGTTTLQLKSTATSRGQILSPTVTIYVSSDVSEIIINCGDKYSWPLAAADVSFTNSNNACVDVTKNGSTLVVTAKQLADNVNTAESTITLSTGAKLRVTVAHLSLTLA